MSWTARIAAVFGALASGPALADAHPPYAPARDFMADYSVAAQDQSAPFRARVFYAARGGRVRIEVQHQPEHFIIDRGQGRMLVVFDMSRTYLDVPFDANLLPNPTMRFARRGSLTIAGVPCTVWDVRGTKLNGEACIAEDGVPLNGIGSASGLGRGEARATRVAYGLQPEALFAPPSDYVRLAMPQLPPGIVPPPALGQR